MIEALKTQFMTYWAFPFVRYAFIVSILIALCSSLLGVTLVLKRMSFIGDSLSHVAFSIMAVASILNLSNNMLITLPGTVIATILLLNNKKGSVKKNDAHLAVISVASLAIGYFLMNVFASGSNVSGDVCTTLFGSMSILTLTKENVILCAILSIVTIISFILLFNKIFAITFDENFARSSGIKVELINFLFSIIIGIIIVLAMNLVGSLLITALIVFPAITSMKLFDNFKKVVVCSAIISVACTLIGLMISVFGNTPVGATIVATDLAAYIIFSIVGKVGGRTYA